MELKDLRAVYLVLLLCVASTIARVLNDTNNENSNIQGVCFYNGTWYEEKEELPTRGLCLICHCFPGFTEPNAFTCAVIDCPWEDYHKRFPGCTPIYADRDCCPIGWECDYGTQNPGQQLSKDPDCKCEWRYLKHYEAKGCRPVYEEKPKDGKPECTCPWRFDCSQAEDVNADEKACVYKKHIYPVGSKIPTTNPCESCSCAKDYFTQAATITCTTTECPSVYSQTPLPEGCHYVYKEHECCPKSVECPANEKENTYKVPVCEYKGKMYYEGEQIYPDEDPCLICLCNSNWTGINSTSCRQHDCMLERDSRKLKQGCIPIYHEKTCCPIDYHCADDDFEFKNNRGANFKSEDDEDEMCHFEGRYYPVGHVLDIKHPTHCVTCTCKTPPDFTCIHSSCPPPPNGDYANCRAVYKPNACCPDYKCHDKKGPSCPDPICQGTNCWLETREDGCAVCRCKSRCVPCPEMCRPEKADNPCSGCICQINTTALAHDPENPKKEEEITEAPAGDSLQILIQECKKMTCASDERCMLVEKKCENESCSPVPQCEKVSFGCGQQSCEEGCEQIGSYENNCPICYCKKEEPQYKLTCHVQSCEENCILTGRDEDGCPLCKCPQGNLEERACAQSYCKGYNCTMTVNTLGCAECRCQLSCKPRECPAGCDMDLDVPRDSGLECGCTCKNSTKAMEFIQSKPLPESCEPVSCEGLNCTVGENQSGCPTCSCKSPCPVPECQEGCRIEKDIKEPGRCPGCICKLSRSARDNAAKECPPPTCLGYNCSVVTGEDGCQNCFCESPCEEEPQCPSHCELETNVPEGRCRGCICSYGEETDAEKTDEAEGTSEHTDEGEPEKRDDAEADFIPMPGKDDLVPSVDKIYLVHGDSDQDQFGELHGYHYDSGHAYPVVGEHLESVLYNAEEKIPGEAESGHPSEEATGDLHEEASEDRHDFDEYDEEKYDHDFAEEKTIDDDDDKCQQKNCPEGQKCVIRRLQCIRTPCPTIPVCIDVEPRCPIPMCSIGCMVMKWDDEVCPSCFCGIIRGAEGRVCPRTRCIGRRCYNVIGDDGCPTCKCDSICIPPECSDGCWIETDPPEGKCPTCTCPSRSTVVAPIIPGTSPAITTSEPNVEPGNDNEIGIGEESTDSSEDYEHSEDKPVNYFEEEEKEVRPSNQDTTSEVLEEVTEKISDTKHEEEQVEPTSTELPTLNFYDSLAEIEEQIRSREKYTTVTVNIPTFYDRTETFETTTGIVADDVEYEQTNTFDHHSPTVTGTSVSDTITSTDGSLLRKPESSYKLKTTLTPIDDSTAEPTTEFSAENQESTGRPCIMDPTTKKEEKKPFIVSTTTTTTTTTTTPTTTTKETSIQDVKVTQRVKRPTPTPSRKPQRKHPARRKPTVPSFENKPITPQRIRPQETYIVRPSQSVTKVQSNQNNENIKVSTSRPGYFIAAQRRKPIPKPQTPQLATEVQTEKNTTSNENEMKPILQNLQTLMSNLNNVLTSHQRPLPFQQATTLGTNTQNTSIAKPLIQTSEIINLASNETNNESEEEALALKTPIQSQTEIRKSADSAPTEIITSSDEKKDNLKTNFHKTNEPSNEGTAKDPAGDNIPPLQFPSFQNNPYQQYYVNNPNIQSLLSSHHMLSNPQLAQMFQQNMNPQYPMFPHFAYQSNSGGIQGYGFLHQPQIANVPYQSHISHPSPTIMHSQSSVVNPLTGQTTGQFAQQQSSFYPAVQHPYPSNIPSSTDHFSHPSTQIQNPHLLLTNIPIPPSLQQQLNAGTQTLGFLQYYLKPSDQALLQQKLQQADPVVVSSPVENKPVLQTETHSGQNLLQAAQKNNIPSNIQQKTQSADKIQNDNAHTSLNRDIQEDPIKETTETPLPIGTNEPSSELKQSEITTIASLSQLNETKEYTMPPFPETSSTTVSTTLNENELSTTSVFYEGGNTENQSSAQQADLAVLSSDLQQFNHHAPQNQQASYVHPQILASLEHNQKQGSQSFNKQQAMVPEKFPSTQQSENQQQNHLLSIEEQLKATDDKYGSSSNSFQQNNMQVSSLHTQGENSQMTQQDTSQSIHATAHFRPVNITNEHLQWQQKEQDSLNSQHKVSQQSGIQNNASQHNVHLHEYSQVNVNQSPQSISSVVIENKDQSFNSGEKLNVLFGMHNLQEQKPSPEPHVTNEERNNPQNTESYSAQGERIQIQLTNLQGQNQYQQNFYQPYQNSQSNQEPLSVHSSVHKDSHNEPFTNSFVNIQNSSPFQEQIQSEKPSSQHHSNQQHFISNHNVHVTQVQSAQNPQHINQQNEVPIQTQQNNFSSSYQTQLNQDKNQYMESQFVKPFQQIHDVPTSQTHQIHQVPQQNIQSFQTQVNSQILQQASQPVHQQYGVQIASPLHDHQGTQQTQLIKPLQESNSPQIHMEKHPHTPVSVQHLQVLNTQQEQTNVLNSQIHKPLQEQINAQQLQITAMQEQMNIQKLSGTQPLKEQVNLQQQQQQQQQHQQQQQQQQQQHQQQQQQQQQQHLQQQQQQQQQHQQQQQQQVYHAETLQILPDQSSLTSHPGINIQPQQGFISNLNFQGIQQPEQSHGAGNTVLSHSVQQTSQQSNINSPYAGVLLPQQQHQQYIQTQETPTNLHKQNAQQQYEVRPVTDLYSHTHQKNGIPYENFPNQVNKDMQSSSQYTASQQAPTVIAPVSSQQSYIQSQTQNINEAQNTFNNQQSSLSNSEANSQSYIQSQQQYINSEKPVLQQVSQHHTSGQINSFSQSQQTQIHQQHSETPQLLSSQQTYIPQTETPTIPQNSLNQQDSLIKPQHSQQLVHQNPVIPSQMQTQQFLFSQMPSQLHQQNNHPIHPQQPHNNLFSQSQNQLIYNAQSQQGVQQTYQNLNNEQSHQHEKPSLSGQHFTNQQSVTGLQNQQHYVVEKPSENTQSVLGHQFMSQQPTNIPTNQQHYVNPEQSSDKLSSAQIQQFMSQQSNISPFSQQNQQVIHQQNTNIPNQQQYVQQFINQQPTTSPQQQYVFSGQSPSQQAEVLIQQQSSHLPQEQFQQTLTQHSSDSVLSSQQSNQFINQQATNIPQHQQQYESHEQSSNSAPDLLKVQQFINQQTSLPQAQQQFIVSHQSPNSAINMQLVPQHFVSQQPTKIPQLPQQYVPVEQSKDSNSYQHHVQQFLNQQAQLQQNQQLYIAAEQSQDKLSMHQHISQMANTNDKVDLVGLRPSVLTSESHPLSGHVQQDFNNPVQASFSDLTPVQSQEQNKDTEQYFVDADRDSTFDQHYQEELANEEHNQDPSSSDSSSYQQYHDDLDVGEDKDQDRYTDDSHSILKPSHGAILNEEKYHGSSSNKRPIHNLSVNDKPQPDETDIDSEAEVSQHSVPPFDPETPKPHAVKTRPGVTSHPHFHPVGYEPPTPVPEPEPEPAHDLFPAPSRPLKQPEIHQEDWVDQEFVEEDIPQEMPFEDEEYEEFYETPSTTTTTTTTTTKRPVVHFKRKPSRRPPIRFSPPTQSTTTSKPYQQEFVESFDNHQPDFKKPVDHQEFFDEFETTTKKYIHRRPTSTRRPSTKSPIKFSLSTVSPTAEAYGLKQQHTTKVPVNPFAYPCPTPHCNGYNCSLIRGSDGCQKCVCDSPCAPCPQHCVKTKTLSEGRCPICDCTVAPTVLAESPRQCPDIDCGGSNCRKVRDDNGCYTCLCDPQCAAPKCDPGCEILTNVPPGQCPGCVCRVTVVQAVVNRPKNCPAVQCTGPLCRTTRGPDGCLQCLCDSCPPPKCDPGCELQTDVAQGQCPTCVCPSYNDDDDDLDDDLYCPNLFCSDYGCREVPGPAGCPICMCDPVCETPVCEPGCTVVTNKHMGKCPVCICSSPSHTDNTSHSSDGIKNAQVPQVQHQHPITFSANDADEVVTQETTAETEEPTVEYTTEEETTTVSTTTTTEPTTTELTTTTELPTTTCPAPVCSGLRCSYETGEDGCEVCKCRYKCPTPKCVGNCYAETNAPAHRCPGCVCPSRRKPALRRP